jgi:HTH-type transcriptional repressor of puuD
MPTTTISPEPTVRRDESVGTALRRLRTERSLSMRQLARIAGLSQPFLSNIENGRSMPSISTLYRLAEALHVNPQELLPAPDDGEARSPQAVAVETHCLEHPDTPLTTLVVGGPEQLTEVRRISMLASDGEPEWFEHTGEEFIHLLDGALSVEFGDGRIETLHAGDSLWYRSSVPHRWVAPEATGAEVLLVNARVPNSYRDATA